MDDWPILEEDLSNSESDSSSEHLETELYSVLHYNSFSKEIPTHLLEKYDIKRGADNEFLISLKKTPEILDVPEVPDGTETKEVVGDSMKNIPEKSLSKETENPIDSQSNSETVDSVRKVQKKNYVANSLVKQTIVISESEEDAVVLISDTDTDGNDSDVVIEEKQIDVVDVCSSSSAECLSDLDNMNDTVINISMKEKMMTFPPDEGVEEPYKIKWREVPSPSSWSEKMKKYYNKASKTLKNFDCEKIRAAIRDQGTWDINADDMFPNHSRPYKRCSFCRQTDHLVKNCPKRFANCSMCGNPGHQVNYCPYKMCLNCGEKNPVFISFCHRCERQKKVKCDECHQIGHVRAHCPDTWRRYHATTSGEINVKPVVLNTNLMCCNCGKRGHLFEDCQSLYGSLYPPTSFLVKNNSELYHSPGGKHNIKKRFNGYPSPSHWRENHEISTPERNFNATPESFRGEKHHKEKNFNRSPKQIFRYWKDNNPEKQLSGKQRKKKEYFKALKMKYLNKKRKNPRGKAKANRSI